MVRWSSVPSNRSCCSSGQAARRQQGDTEAALAAREAELVSQRASHRAETAELNTRLQEANEEREHLLDELRATQDKEGKPLTAQCSQPCLLDLRGGLSRMLADACTPSAHSFVLFLHFSGSPVCLPRRGASISGPR